MSTPDDTSYRATHRDTSQRNASLRNATHRHINLDNIWDVIAIKDDDGSMRREFEDYLRQNPSAEELAWQDREEQRDRDRDRAQREWTVRR
jgi:hypothetical protein